MKQGRASRTAELNALFRALESARPAGHRLIQDPFAAAFLTWPYEWIGRLAVVRGVPELVAWYIDSRYPGARPAVVARTRLIDDAIAGYLSEPIRQMVILGAGLDSRAYRMPELAGLAVFEVDHPDTQRLKLEQLARALPELPEHVHFVACDFANDDLGTLMAASGYDGALRTLILWEGTTNYLTEAAVDATLRWISGAPPESLLLFTYVHRDILIHPERFAGSARLRSTLDKQGEQFRFGIDPQELPTFLAKYGFALESDVGAAKFRARYYGEAARRMRGHEFYRVAMARRGAPGAGRWAPNHTGV